MAGNGNGKQVDNFDPSLMSLDEFKRLLPGGKTPPMFSHSLGENNPGVRILSSDEPTPARCRSYKFLNDNQSAKFAFALGESEEFIYKDDPNGLNEEVLRVQNRVQYKAECQVSTNGFGLDQYKQTAIAVATSVSTDKGVIPLNIPGFSRKNDGDHDGNNKQSANNRKP